MKAAICVLALLAATAAEAASIRDLLPPPEKVRPWATPDALELYAGTRLSNLLDGGAEVYLQYGFVQAVTQEYVLGDDSIDCTVYEMRDPDGAFGIFSYMRTPKKSPVALGDGGFASDLQLAFWQDRYFVLLGTFSAAAGPAKALPAFARDISHRIGRHAGPPAVLARLPARYLIAGSEKLLRGRLATDALFPIFSANVVQLSGDDVLLSGDYRVDGSSTRVFVLLFGRSEAGGRAFADLEKAVSSGGPFRALTASATDRAWVEDGRSFLARRVTDGLALVAGASSLEEARTVLDGTTSTR